jgi:hypothetical protein
MTDSGFAMALPPVATDGGGVLEAVFVAAMRTPCHPFFESESSLKAEMIVEAQKPAFRGKCSSLSSESGYW